MALINTVYVIIAFYQLFLLCHYEISDLSYTGWFENPTQIIQGTINSSCEERQEEGLVIQWVESDGSVAQSSE